jgi:glyoxylate/hydroxypyruvate/2-ketogluconate reductase
MAAQDKKILVARQIFPEGIARLREFAQVDYHDQALAMSPDDFAKRLAQADAALVTGSETVDVKALANVERLKIVSNIAVGYNNFDVKTLTEKGVMATNTPDVLTDTTADMGFMLLMAAARRLSESEHWLRAGSWRNWSLDGMLGVDVHHSKIGILGMGRIGQGIAKRARAFEMQVFYHNRSRLSPDIEASCSATYLSKEELLQTVDHVVLVMPYTPENHHYIDAKELALMKPSATLVNIARGGIVNDSALADALANRTIFAAGLDVYEGEPKLNPKLLEVPNVVLAPHIGSATENTRRAMMNLAIDNLLAGLRGERPPSLINPETFK